MCCCRFYFCCSGSDFGVRFAATVTAAAALAYVADVVPGFVAVGGIAAAGCVAQTLHAIAVLGRKQMAVAAVFAVVMSLLVIMMLSMQL